MFVLAQWATTQKKRKSIPGGNNRAHTSRSVKSSRSKSTSVSLCAFVFASVSISRLMNGFSVCFISRTPNNRY